MTRASERPRVLVVDDEPGARSAMTELLREEGYEVRSAADGFKALGVLEQFSPDVVLTDVKMPGLDGISFMTRARESNAELAVVVMTAFGSVESAVDALRLGADDYLTKPLDFDTVQRTVRRCVERRALAREVARMRDDPAASEPEDGLIGISPAFTRMRGVIEQVAATALPVLLTGEPGCGMERVAAAIHARSARRGEFVRISCDSLSPERQRRELLGLAGKDDSAGSPSAFERAHGGTLLLEGVHALAPYLQVELANLLERGAVEEGEGEAEPPARLLASSHEDLRDAVERKSFREDLFFRLAVVELRVPALRERVGDLPLLATAFLRGLALREGLPFRPLGERALAALLQCEWPGNLHELEGALRHAAGVARGTEITPRDLPPTVYRAARGTNAPPIPGSSMSEIERYAILRTLEEVGGSTSRAAKILGISPRKIQYRLAEYRESD